MSVAGVSSAAGGASSSRHTQALRASKLVTSATRRQEADRHTEALDWITRELGVGGYGDWSEDERQAFLVEALEVFTHSRFRPNRLPGIEQPSRCPRPPF